MKSAYTLPPATFLTLLLYVPEQKYVDFNMPIVWDAAYSYMLAALAFIVTLRLLRVLGYNQRITMLATVLANSGRTLAGYLIIFSIVMAAFVSAGHLLFVTSLDRFRSVLDTCLTLYSVMLGRSTVGHWMAGQDISLLTQVYFVTFAFLMLFVLYCMFQVSACLRVLFVCQHTSPFAFLPLSACLSASQSAPQVGMCACMKACLCMYIGATRGVTVSMSALLACRQCYCAGSSLA